jgi:hypothetical protein
MKKELFNKSINLKDSIAPQYFSVQEDGICYFDRINAEEGRFWHIREGQHSIVFEIDKGQGMLDENGNMYILDTRERTTLVPIQDQKLQEPVELEGIFYDYKISQSGSYVFLGNDKGSNIIQLKAASGADTAEIHVPELVFASCLALDKENIYLGGIEKGGRLAVASINYLGSINRSWVLDCSSKERFVGKLQLYGQKIIMLIGGAYDTIGILNMEGGEFREIEMGRLNLKGCADLQVFNDQIYMLSGKAIMSIDIKALEEMVQYPAYGLHIKNRDSFSYEYLMYTKSMRNQVLSSMLPAVVFSSFITILLMITGQIYFESYLQQGIFQLFMAIVGVYLISSMRNITDLVDKSLRVDNLLGLYNESGSIASRYAFPLLASGTILSFIYLLGFPGTGRLYSLIAGALSMIIFSSLQIQSLRKLKLEKDDVIVELLRDDDLETEMAIRAALRSMKSQGCEEMLINIATVDKAIVHRIDRWASTRKGIIGEMSPAVTSNNIISVTLDFSKRDIRYSRFSIAMDYISYLKKSAIISIMDIQGNHLTNKSKN